MGLDVTAQGVARLLGLGHVDGEGQHRARPAPAAPGARPRSARRGGGRRRWSSGSLPDARPIRAGLGQPGRRRRGRSSGPLSRAVLERCGASTSASQARLAQTSRPSASTTQVGAGRGVGQQAQTGSRSLGALSRIGSGSRDSLSQAAPPTAAPRSAQSPSRASSRSQASPCSTRASDRPRAGARARRRPGRRRRRRPRSSGRQRGRAAPCASVAPSTPAPRRRRSGRCRTSSKAVRAPSRSARPAVRAPSARPLDDGLARSQARRSRQAQALTARASPAAPAAATKAMSASAIIVHPPDSRFTIAEARRWRMAWFERARESASRALTGLRATDGCGLAA